MQITITPMHEILGGYVSEGDSVIGPDGLEYECPTRNNVVVILRQNADGSEFEVVKFDDPKYTGKDAAATMQFLPGTGDMQVSLSTRDDQGVQAWAHVKLSGVCPAPDAVVDVYHGAYTSNDMITKDGLLYLRLDHIRAAVLQLQEAAIRDGKLRRA